MQARRVLVSAGFIRRLGSMLACEGVGAGRVWQHDLALRLRMDSQSGVCPPPHLYFQSASRGFCVVDLCAQDLQTMRFYGSSFG